MVQAITLYVRMCCLLLVAIVLTPLLVPLGFVCGLWQRRIVWLPSLTFWRILAAGLMLFTLVVFLRGDTLLWYSSGLVLTWLLTTRALFLTDDPGMAVDLTNAVDVCMATALGLLVALLWPVTLPLLGLSYVITHWQTHA